MILGGLWNLYGAGIYFQKFFNKPMQRERDFGGFKYFSKISYPPPESQLDPPINAVFTTSLINRLTHPQHTPARTKGTGLANENETKSRCQRGLHKVYAMATPFAYVRVYPEPSVSPVTQSARQSVHSQSVSSAQISNRKKLEN